MKIMLVCAGGLSTGILMNKMKKYAADKGLELEVKAYAVSDYAAHADDYDCVLMGPQIAYKEEEIRKALPGKAVAVINSMDYAMGNAEAILDSVKAMGIQ